MQKLKLVRNGKRFKVSLTEEVSEAFAAADAKERARCLKWLEMYAEDGPQFLDKTKLRNEGRFSIGDRAGTVVAVLAFKAWQLRLYGGVVQGNHFVATEIDTSKKTDKADQQLLKRAARKLAPYF